MGKKLIVGLTGGFGSGKSTVAKMFAAKGACVIHADPIAHKALTKRSPVFKKIEALFPGALSRCGRRFVRSKIAEKVFSDPKKRERLEALVHPYVLQEIQKKIRATKKRVVVVEVPLLFEAGFDVFFDRIVSVKCDASAKRPRLCEKGFTPKQVCSREEAQMSESLKAKKADFVINNSSSISKTRKDVDRLWKRFSALAKGE